MSNDVAKRIYEVITALGRAPEPDMERIEYLVRRTGRLDSLRRQVERLEDELELELVSSGIGFAAGEPSRSGGDGAESAEGAEGERRRADGERRREVDELQIERPTQPHARRSRAIRTHFLR